MSDVDRVSHNGLNSFPNKSWFLHICSTSLSKTLSQTTNFRCFHTEWVCRRQFQVSRQKDLKKGRKHCGKRRNFSLWAISPFPTVFSKEFFCRHVKTRACLGKRSSINLIQKRLPFDYKYTERRPICKKEAVFVKQQCNGHFFENCDLDILPWPWLMTLNLVSTERSCHKVHSCEIWRPWFLPI